ncbi:ATP dependent dna ligase domain protein [Apiospora marii]|uniref:ATP dependent dna ligase domain protein n=1 Tax=Apiospora marii TaxID=335849 RepID=A0ABR1R2L9_9PEZI
MPFQYKFVCDLLQQLEDEAHSTSKERTPTRTIIERWFHEHRVRLDAPTVNGCAVISTLLPERRTDRVYGIQTTRLESIVGQALILGSSRVKELRRYKTPGQGVDLGDCIESILSRAPNSIHPDREVTVEDIDEVLTRVAAGCRFSSPAIRASNTSRNPQSENHVLGQFFTRLSPRDAKWFTRLILKNYQPIVLEERVVLRAYHALLPRMLKVRDDLQVATDFLQHVDPSQSDPKAIASLLKPALGTKVGRPPWLKARSIKNCLDIIGRRQASCEQKIDGEYCQIHVDLNNRDTPIQIFSKSGKDSTQDRRRLHPAIRDSLRLGQQDCPIKTGCILEGELVDNKVLPFHKIRKHVSRSGSYLGSKNDSQRHDYEHLMIIYYDILMVDTQSMLGMKHSERIKRLERLITCRKGYAEIVQRQIISFSRHSAASALREAFAKCIVAKGEGLVLKPDEPYFDFGIRQSRFGSCVIKLKKEYVQGWGDVGDFAVIGASYNAVKAKSYNISNLKWTHFFIGCLENRDRARARSEKPTFVVTNVVELPETLLQTLRTQCEPRAVPFDDNESFSLDFSGTGTAQNRRKSYLDAISFAELQQAAYTATEAPELEDSQEMRHWISALEKADPRGRAVDEVSQETVSSGVSRSSQPSPSPAKSTRNDRLTSIAQGSIGELTPRTTSRQESGRPSVGLATPPRSSATEIKEPAEQTDAISRDAGLRPGKRTAETLGIDTISKKQRKPVSIQDENFYPDKPSSTSSQSWPPRDRRPLGSIGGKRSPADRKSFFQGASSLFTRPQPQPIPSSPAGENGIASSTTSSFHTANEIPSSPPPPPQRVSTSRSEGPDKPVPQNPDAETQVSSGALGQTQRSAKTSRVRKICLVETRRPEATHEFLKRIEKTGLERRNGRREWVAVYDWKILEDFAKIEAGVVQKGPDPWRQRYVGIA